MLMCYYRAVFESIKMLYSTASRKLVLHLYIILLQFPKVAIVECFNWCPFFLILVHAFMSSFHTTLHMNIAIK